MNTETRFWSHVNKDGPRFGNRGRCWMWTGNKINGYGKFWLDGRMVPAHLFAFGEMPDGLEPDHLCRQRACVQRTHLEAVTHLENVRRGDAGRYWAAKTHCPNNHLLSGDNLYITPDGRRQCRRCRRDSTRRYRQRMAA